MNPFKIYLTAIFLTMVLTVGAQNIMQFFTKCDTVVAFDWESYCIPNIGVFKDTINFKIIEHNGDTIIQFKVFEIFDNKGKAIIREYLKPSDILISEAFYDSDTNPLDSINGGEIIYKYDALKNGVFKSWDKKGRLKTEQTFKEGLANGLWTEYYLNGKKKSEGHFFQRGKYTRKYKVGLWRSWIKEGNVYEEINYEYGLKSGKYLKYHSNGIVSVQGEYVQVLSKGAYYNFNATTFEEELKMTDEIWVSVKDGAWHFQNDKMELTKTRFYDKGTLLKEVEYN